MSWMKAQEIEPYTKHISRSDSCSVLKVLMLCPKIYKRFLVVLIAVVVPHKETGELSFTFLLKSLVRIILKLMYGLNSL